MIKLLREHQLATEFKKLKARQPVVSLAAPFWGEGAAGTLGLRRGPEIRVLCRFDSPACNPKALLELAKVGATIRWHRRLHAKLYITGAGVIVGSSNPSKFGVTQEGDALSGTVEANILTDDSSMMDEVCELFDALWSDKEETSTVSMSMIEQEMRRRALEPPVLPTRALAAQSLLSACREAPELFGGVLVVAYRRGLDPGGKAALHHLQEQASAPDERLGVADFRKAWGYQFEDAPPAGSWLVDVDCRGALPRIRGASQVPTPALRLRVGGENDVTPTIRGVVNVPGTRNAFRISAQDRVDLASIAPRLLRGDADFVPLPQVLAMIDRQRPSSPRTGQDGSAKRSPR